MIKLEWSEFKQQVNNRSLNIQYKEHSGFYDLLAYDGLLFFNCTLSKSTPANSDQTDFENNFKSDANAKLGNPSFVVDGSMKTTPTISSSIRLDISSPDSSHSGSSFESLYSYSGSGLLYGFYLDLDSDKAIIKLILDSNEVFSIALKDLKDLGFEDSAHSLQAGNFFTMPKNDKLDFSPRFPIEFNSSIEIQAKTSDNNSFKLKRYLINLTKES